jgi:TrmH family RNA methyltransferase
MAASDDLLARITVILHHPRTAENVGATARAMANMGLSRLIVAEPGDFDPVRARVVATSARSLLDAAESTKTLDPILERYAVLVATSAEARPGLPALDPETAAERLVSAAAEGRAVALLFGDERTGLPRRALDRCHGLSTIPTAPGHASLNLAQAVLVHAYALGRAARSRATASGPPAAKPAPLPEADAPPMAEVDLERLRKQAFALFRDAGFLNPDQPDKVCGELDRLLVRGAPSEREGRLLLALVKQLAWAVRTTGPHRR